MSITKTVSIPEKERYTYEDYAELPEGAPYQLINGELVMTPAPTTFHQQVVGNLHVALYRFVEPDDKGVVLFSPVDVYFSETETYQPDIVFIASDRRDIVEEQKINGAPDLLIEVLSPSTGYYDLTHKKRIYAAHGVKEYWVVDPIEKTVELFENEDGDFSRVVQLQEEGKVASRVLEGFGVDLAEIFTGNVASGE